MRDTTDGSPPGNTEDGSTTQDTAPIETSGRETRRFAPTAAARRVDTSSEWFWPVINLVGLVVVIAVNALANITELNGLSTGEVVDRNPVYFQPAGWTFSIWSIIYILLAVFVVYTFLRVGRADPRMRLVGPVFLVANIANALWIVFWHYGQWGVTLAIMTVLLVSLILIYYLLRRRRGHAAQPPAVERLMVWTPFSVYLGWVSVAFLSNVAVWADRTGTGVLGMGGRWSAVVFLIVLVVGTALMALWMRDPTYAVVVAWAALGIAVEQWDRSKLVSIAAGLAVILAAALAVFGSLLAFEMRLRGHGVHTAPQPADHHGRFWRRTGE